MRPNNPFVTTGYQGKEFFCDRERETQKILSALENERNVTLIAPRRYGKTGLVQNVLHSLPKGYLGIYLDIYATRNLVDFTRSFASAVVGMADTPLEKTMATVAHFFRSCRPTITPQEDGLPKFSFDIAPAQAEATLHDAFEYLKRHERNIVIAIDEFQQILEYPEAGTEALLRSYIQGVPWVHFIFAGSRQHLMGEMFLSVKHPFYNSTDILSLDSIPQDVYCAFAEKFFSKGGFPFKKDAFAAVYDRVDGITWYVQRLLNCLWDAGAGLEEAAQGEAVLRELVSDRAMIFRDLLESQNTVARKVLLALAAEGCVPEPGAGAFLSKYSLVASSVRSVLKDLAEREIVYKSERGYIIYERLFGEWLKSCLVLND